MEGREFLIGGKVASSNITNNIVKDAYGVVYGTMTNSIFANNSFNVSHPFMSIDCYSNAIANNTAWGKPFLFVNQSNKIYDSLDLGAAYLCNVRNVSFINTNITKGGLGLQNVSDIKLRNFYLSSPSRYIGGFNTQNVTFENGKIENYRMQPSKNLVFNNITLTNVYLVDANNITMEKVKQTDSYELIHDLNKGRIVNSKISRISVSRRTSLKNLFINKSSIGHIGYRGIGLYWLPTLLENLTITNSNVTSIAGYLYNSTIESSNVTKGRYDTAIFLKRAKNVRILNNNFSRCANAIFFSGVIENLVIKGNNFRNYGSVFAVAYSGCSYVTEFSNFTQANNTVYGYPFYFFNPGSPVININNSHTFFGCYNISLKLSNISFDVPSDIVMPYCNVTVYNSNFQAKRVVWAFQDLCGWAGGGVAIFNNSTLNLTCYCDPWGGGDRRFYNSIVNLRYPMEYGNVTVVNSTLISNKYGLFYICDVNISGSHLKGKTAVFAEVQGKITDSVIETMGTCIYNSKLNIDNSKFRCDRFAYTTRSYPILNVYNSNIFAYNSFFDVYGSSFYKLNLINNTFIAFPNYGIKVVASTKDSKIQNNIFVCSQKDGVLGTVNFQDGTNTTIYNNIFQDCNITWNPNIAWNVTKNCSAKSIIGGCLGGNYYSTYNGSDADNDGIGDTPYGYDQLPLKVHHIDFNGTPWYPNFNTSSPLTLSYYTIYGNGSYNYATLQRKFDTPFYLTHTKPLSPGTYSLTVKLQAQDITNQTTFKVTIQDFNLTVTQNVSNEYPAYGWIMPKRIIKGKPISFEANITGNVTFMLTNGTDWLCYNNGWQVCNESMNASIIASHIKEWPYKQLNWKAIIGVGGILHWVKIVTRS